MSGRSAKQAAWSRGKRGELLARWLLRLKGYRILAANLRLPGGEIDIVARRGRTLAFVEIKSRAGEVSAEAIPERQWRRIARAAEQFVARRPDCARLNGRFDAMLLAPGRPPRHIADAWRP